MELIDLGELCYNFLSQMTLLRWSRLRSGLSQSCSFRFLSSDASICSAMALPPLENSDHVVDSVSIDFPSNSKRDAPFHYIAYDYSRANLGGLPNHLKDDP